MRVMDQRVPVRAQAVRARLIRAASPGVMAAVMALQPQMARAQAFQGAPDVIYGSANIEAGTNATNITVNSEQVTINWTPSDTAPGPVPINFLPAGTTAFFSGQVPAFTVLNRVIAADPTRAIQFNGTVNSTPNGSIWFYAPGGILLSGTSRFEVGSLLLTANDPVGAAAGQPFIANGNQFRLAAASGSTARVAIDAGAQINAPFPASYVIAVAPQFRMDGAISVNGSAALVAAEDVSFTLNGGLFDITANVGSLAGGTAQVTGSITGPGGVADGDFHRVYMMAVPRNEAMTLLITGGAQIGFDIASSADVDGNAIVLSAGYDVRAQESGASLTQFSQLPAAGSSGAATLALDAAGFTSNVVGRSRTDASAVAQSGGLNFQEGLALYADASAVIGARSGQTLFARGDLVADASTHADLGAGAGKTAGVAEVSATTGSVVESLGGISAIANGRGDSGANLGAGGTGTGGVARLLALGGTVQANALVAIADGIGGKASAGRGGSGIGGQARAEVTGPGTLLPSSGGIDLLARGLGEMGVAGQESGDATGGIATLALGAGATINTLGTVRLDAGARYIVQSGTANLGGGTVQGGVAEVVLQPAASLAVNRLELLATASGVVGTGGNAFRGGTASLQISDLQLDTVVEALGSVLIDAGAIGGSGAAGGNGTGGSARGVAALVTANGSPIVRLGADGAVVTADAIGGAGLSGWAGGNAEGGSARVVFNDGGSVEGGSLVIAANVVGGAGDTGGSAAALDNGDANAPAALLRYGPNGNQDDFGLQLVGNLRLSASARGGAGSIGAGGAASGGYAVLQQDSKATTASSVTLDIAAEGGVGNGGGGGQGGRGQVGLANAQLQSGEGLLLNAGGRGGGALDAAQAGGNGNGGVARVLADQGALITGAALLIADGTGGAPAPGASLSGSGTGGLAEILVNGGSATFNGGSVSASGFFGTATGGTVRAAVQAAGGSLVLAGDTVGLIARGASGLGNGQAGLGTATGGTVAISTVAGGTLVLANGMQGELAIDVSGDVDSGGADNGSHAIGGTILISNAGSTSITDTQFDLRIESRAVAGGTAGDATLAGGAATGGSVMISNTAGTLALAAPNGEIRIGANAFAGSGAAVQGNAVGGSITMDASGGTIDLAGTTRLSIAALGGFGLQSGIGNGTGGTASISFAGGGLIDVAGDLTVDHRVEGLIAAGGTTSLTGAAGGLDVAGSLRLFNDVFLETGADGSQALGGAINIDTTAASSISIGSNLDAFVGANLQGFGADWIATGGSIAINSGGSFTVGGSTSLSASAAFLDGAGGTASAGTISVAINSGLFSQSGLFLAARAVAGAVALGTGPAATGGAISLQTLAGGSFAVNGPVQLEADAEGGGSFDTTGSGGGTGTGGSIGITNAGTMALNLGDSAINLRTTGTGGFSAAIGGTGIGGDISIIGTAGSVVVQSANAGDLVIDAAGIGGSGVTRDGAAFGGDVLVSQAATFTLPGGLEIRVNAISGDSAPSGNATGGTATVNSSGGTTTINGNLVLNGDAAVLPNAANGNGTGGTLAVSANGGTLAITGNLVLSAQGSGLQALGGGITMASSNVLAVDGGISATASVLSDIIDSNALAQAGQIMVDVSGSLLVGAGMGLFADAQAAQPATDLLLRGGAISLISTGVTAIGGSGLQMNSSALYATADGAGGGAQAGNLMLDVAGGGFTTANMILIADGLGGNNPAGTGGSGEGGSAIFQIGAGATANVAGIFQISADGIGGNGLAGGAGAGGTAQLAAAGTATIEVGGNFFRMRSNGTGGTGSAGAGGNGDGGLTILTAIGKNSSLAIGGAGPININATAIGLGGAGSNAGGSGFGGTVNLLADNGGILQLNGAITAAANASGGAAQAGTAGDGAGGLISVGANAGAILNATAGLSLLAGGAGGEGLAGGNGFGGFVELAFFSAAGTIAGPVSLAAPGDAAGGTISLLSAAAEGGTAATLLIDGSVNLQADGAGPAAEPGVIQVASTGGSQLQMASLAASSTGSADPVSPQRGGLVAGAGSIIAVAGDINFVSRGSLALNDGGTITAGGIVQFDAAGLLVSGFDAPAAGAVGVITAPQVRLFSGAEIDLVTRTTGSGDVQMLSGGGVRLADISGVGDVTIAGSRIDFASLRAGRDLGIETSGAVTGGGISAGGRVRLDAGAAVVVGPIDAGIVMPVAAGPTDIEISVAGPMQAGQITSSSDVAILVADGAAVLGDISAGGDIRIDGGQALQLGNGTAAGRISLLAGGALGAGALSAAQGDIFGRGSAVAVGAVTAGSDIGLLADTALASGALSSGRDLVLLAGGTIATAALATPAGGRVRFGPISAAELISFAAGVPDYGALFAAAVGTVAGNIVVNGAISTGLLDVATAGLFQARDGITANTGARISGQSIDVGDVQSLGFIELTSATDLLIGNLTAAGGLTLATTGNITTGNLDVGGSLILAATQGAGGGGALTTGSIRASDDIRLTAATTLATGSLSAGDSVFLNAGGLILTGNIDAGTVLPAQGASGVLFASSPGMISTGAINISGSATLSGVLGVTSGNIAAPGGIVLLDTGGIATGDLATSASGFIYIASHELLPQISFDSAGNPQFAALLASTPTRLIGDISIGSAATGSFIAAATGSFGAQAITAASGVRIDVGGTASLAGGIGAGKIAITSDDIVIAPGTIIGGAGASEISLAANASMATANIGGGDVAGPYSLSNAEFGSLRATSVSVLLPGGTMTVGSLDLPVSTAQQSLPTSISLSSGGVLRVNGAVTMAAATSANSLTLQAGNRIELATDSGRIQLGSNADAPAGILTLTAGSVRVGTAALLGQIAAGTLAGTARDAALNAVAASPALAGQLIAGGVRINAAQDVLIQNSGDAATRAGFTAGSGGLIITATGSQPTLLDLVINGRVAGAGGLFLLNDATRTAVAVQPGVARLAANAQVNGCALVAGCAVTPPPEPPLPDPEPEPEPGPTAEAEQQVAVIVNNVAALTPDAVLQRDRAQAAVEKLPIVVLQRLIDFSPLFADPDTSDPATSGGNPALWPDPVPGGVRRPGGLK